MVSHGRKGLDICHATAFAKCRVSSFYMPDFKFSVLGGAESMYWQAPQGMTIKFSCDGSLYRDPNRAGMGSVMRDSSGIG